MTIFIAIVSFLLGFVGGALFGIRNVGRVELAKEAISAELDELMQKLDAKTDVDEKMMAKYLELKARWEKLLKRLEGLGF